MEEAGKPLCTPALPRTSANGEPSKRTFRVTGDLKSLASEMGFGDSRLCTTEGAARRRPWLGFTILDWGLLSLLLMQLCLGLSHT